MMTEDMLKSYLNTLRLDLNFFKDSIREVSQDIISEGFSEYPVFIAHQADVKIGEVILDREELGSNFTIQATTLEDLVEKKVVLPANVEKFKKAYKDPEKQCCIFLVTEHGAQFVFVPFELNTDTKAETEN
ncbi:MAG: hypothetical protein JNM67_13290 [Bacteroidetes bacterium]|nr:hypothetical protein [Bacteroidota bacterium]